MAGALATTGLLLGAYLTAPREPDAAASLAVRGTDPPQDPSPEPSARMLAAQEPMSSYTTNFTPGEPRVRNIELAAEMLDGHVVAAGETFSFNGVVGPRTSGRGYVPAPAIMGSRLVNDVGGGICQVSSTLFNAVFRAGLEISRSRSHTMYMPEYPEGREAAVDYPDLDFRWRNDSARPVRIGVEHTASSVTVNLYGERRYQVRSATSARYGITPPYQEGVGRGRECVPTAGREGFKVDVWRTLLDDGRPVSRERFHTVYDPQPKVQCR